MGDRRGVRRQAREVALQALFMCDFLSNWDLDLIEFCFEHFCVPKLARPYARQLCHTVVANLSKIDTRLTSSSENWSISRMSRVDRTVIRIAIAEMFLMKDVPVSVAIDEAVEIAKHFAADESPMFINGVLDRAAASLKNQVQMDVVQVIEEVAEMDVSALEQSGARRFATEKV